MSQVSHAIVVGPDENELSVALEENGVTVTRLEGVLTRPQLEEAGIVETPLYVLTDISQATTIPIVKDLADTRVVVYSTDSLPEFVSAQTDIAIDPALLEPEIVAEELVGSSEQ